MLNHAVDSVAGYTGVPSSTLSRIESNGQNALLPQETDFLDEVPVMPATVFGLDMLFQEPNIDLRMASELVLSDVGATIQTLRLVLMEYEIAAERPNRMCECIAGLDTRLLFKTLSTRIYVGEKEHPAATAVWKHCRWVAQCARFVAESMDDITPDDAYMVGLLHGIGAIPAALNWPESQLRSAMSSMEETFPPFALAAIRSINDSSCTSVWRFILTAAHKLAGVQVNPHAPVFRQISSIAMSTQ